MTRIKLPRKNCLVCGKIVKRTDTKFCSFNCYTKYWMGRKKPNAYKRIEKICPVCKKVFLTGGRIGNPNKIFCSIKCSGFYQRKPMDNIKDRGRSAFWRELRRKIIKRDNNECQFCGVKKDEKELQVHHIIPLSVESNFEEFNLITCCRRCHSIVNLINKIGYENNLSFDPNFIVQILKIK